MGTEVTRIDKVWVQTKHLNFQNFGRQGTKKTEVYGVRLRLSGKELGMIWWGKNFRYDFTSMYPKIHDEISAAVKQELEAVCTWLTVEYRRLHPRRQPTDHQRRLRRIQNLLKKPDGGGLDNRYAPVV